jgi:hypothetical protein
MNATWGRADVQGLGGGFPHRDSAGPPDRVSCYPNMVDMRDTRNMSQYAHARALHLLEDTGLDPDDARYVMKRLYDLGLGYVGTRDTGPGASPPGQTATSQHPRKVARAQHRADLIEQMRAETARARAEKAAELEAAIAAQRQREADEKATRDRQLAVQAVLAGMP